MTQFIHDAIWQIFFGWTQLVPIEAWWVLGGIAALVVLRFLGWPGLAALAAAIGYYFGVKRGADFKAPLPPSPQPPAPTPAAPAHHKTIFDMLRGR